MKWFLNLIAIITIYSIISVKFEPFINEYVESEKLSKLFSWITAFLIAAPSTWAMLNTFQCNPNDLSTQKSLRIKALVLFISRIITILITICIVIIAIAIILITIKTVIINVIVIIIIITHIFKFIF